VDRVAPVLRIGSIVLRVDDLQRQTEFREAAPGSVREVHRDERPPDADYVILADPEAKPLLRRGHQLVERCGYS
jgi:hypothetical protein